MRTIARFLLAVLSVAPVTVVAAPVSQTAGSNLTQYNGSMGSISGNQWNADTNPRSNMKQPGAKADYGNCEAVILRCAKPKCSGTGCADMAVAQSIVAGCVNSNSTCKKHGDGLIGTVAAQLVSASVAEKNKQDAAVAAQAAAAEQNSAAMQQQMQEMQQQMQQQMMQMQQQNSQQIASLQSALAESQQATADAVAAAAKSAADNVIQNSSTVVDAGTGLTEVQAVAAKSGVSEDTIARATISGQVLTSMQGVDTSLENLKTVMRDAFRYGKCNEVNGDNCEGPKRVKKFRELAQKFFAPYEALENNLEDALYKAQSVGVDLGNIYMFFDGSCNRWAKYICRGNYEQGLPIYTVAGKYITEPLPNGYAGPATLKEVQVGNCKCDPNGKNCKSLASGETRGGHDCYHGQTIPPEDLKACTVNVFLDASDKDITDNIINPDVSSDGTIRVGCASDFNKSLFRRRRSSGKGKTGIDIDLLQMLISQSEGAAQYHKLGDTEGMENTYVNQNYKWGCKAKDNDKKLLVAQCFCGVGTEDGASAETVLTELQAAVISKTLKRTTGASTSGGACCTSPGADCTVDCYDLDEDVSYIDPVFTLCDTHAWNADYKNNAEALEKTDSADKMKQIIGLKTTIIAQQMYKQYSTLEKMIKQVKIMLEKEVLKADLQVAGGTSSGNDDSDSSNDNKQEYEKCTTKSDETEVMNCLRRNLVKYEPLVDKHNVRNDLKKAMKQDAETLKTWCDDGDKCPPADTSYFDCNNITKTTLEGCYRALAKGITGLSKKIKNESSENKLLQRIYEGKVGVM